MYSNLNAIVYCFRNAFLSICSSLTGSFLLRQCCRPLVCVAVFVLLVVFVGSVVLLRSHLLSIMLVLSGGIQMWLLPHYLYGIHFVQSFRACKTKPLGEF